MISFGLSENIQLQTFTFYYRSRCIIDDGASRRRTRNTRFQAKRANHSTTFSFFFYYRSICIIDDDASRRRTLDIFVYLHET